jgi:hypothetical protein
MYAAVAKEECDGANNREGVIQAQLSALGKIASIESPVSLQESGRQPPLMPLRRAARARAPKSGPACAAMTSPAALRPRDPSSASGMTAIIARIRATAPRNAKTGSDVNERSTVEEKSAALDALIVPLFFAELQSRPHNHPHCKPTAPLISQPTFPPLLQQFRQRPSCAAPSHAPGNTPHRPKSVAASRGRRILR